MSFLFHRPQSVGELLDVSLNIVKHHLVLLLHLGIWPIVGIAAIDLGTRALPEDSSLALLTLPLSYAVYSLGEAGLSFAVRRLLHGHAVYAPEVWTRVRESLGSVAIGYTVKWLAVMFGLLFLIVPGALLLVRWFAVPAVNVIERGGLRGSFQRSRELARGNRAQILVTVSLLDVGMTIGFLTLAVILTDSTTGVTPLWLSLLSWAVGLLYLLYHAVLSTALYANSRVRNEGYEVEELIPSPAGAA